MEKWICEECGSGPCTLEGSGGTLWTYPKCMHPTKWREVKEPEPKLEPDWSKGFQIWEMPTGQHFMSCECPGCKEKDEEIEGLKRDIRHDAKLDDIHMMLEQMADATDHISDTLDKWEPAK